MVKIKPLTEKEIIKGISMIIKEHLPDCRAVLFGSRAKGSAHERSDFDVALITKGRIPASILFRIRDDIDKLKTLKIIEIIDFNKLDEDFQKIILKEGKNIYDGSSQNPIR